MNLEERLHAMFPGESDVPAEFRIEDPIICDRYLINGELRHWDGPLRDVLACVSMNIAGDLTPKLLGRYPLMTEKET